MSQMTDITIIGAGVIGLAIASELSEKGYDILLLEKNEKYGMEQSSRNNEVIHAGIYYEQDSLKTKMCLEISEWYWENAHGAYVIAPEIEKKETAHFILKVTDKGKLQLSRYKRVIVNIIQK